MSFTRTQIVVPITQALQLTSGSGTAVNTLLSAGANYKFVIGIFVASTDTVARVVDLYIETGSGDLVFGSVSVPAGQGTGGLPALEILLPMLPTTWDGLPLSQSGFIRVSLEVALTAGKVMNFLLVGGLQ